VRRRERKGSGRGREGGEGGKENVVITPHMQSAIQYMQYTCNGGCYIW